MILRPSTLETLAGFGKRMKHINIAQIITECTYPDYIRKMIPNRHILSNAILAVLVYINDEALGARQKCTLADITRFLEDFARTFPPDCKVDV